MEMNGDRITLYHRGRGLLFQALHEGVQPRLVVNVARRLLELRAGLCETRARILEEQNDSLGASSNRFAAQQLRRAAETLSVEGLTPSYTKALATMLPPDP